MGVFTQSIRRATLFLCFIFTLSCTLKDKTTSSDTLVVAIESHPNVMDPRVATRAVAMRLSNLIFSSLIRVGPDLTAKGDAAKEWAYKDKIWTFKIKPSLSFSNGRKVTAEDLIFTFNEYRKPSNIFSGAFKDIERVWVEEDKGKLVLKLKMKRYSAKFLLADLPVVAILPKKEVLESGRDFFKVLIGTGPLALEKQNDQEIILRRKKSQHSNQIKRIVFKVIKDDFTRYQKLIKGEVDLIQGAVPLSKIKQLRERSEEFQIHKNVSLSTTYLLFNLKRKDLAQRKLRQAISHSIHTEEIIKYNLEEMAVKARSLLPPHHRFFDKNLPPNLFSLEKAKASLKDLSVGPLNFKTSNDPATVKNTKVLVRQLSKAGIKVNLQSLEVGAYFSSLKKGQFDLAFANFSGILDPDIYRIAFHSSQQPPNGRNRGHYSNPRVDRLLEEGISKKGFKERFRIYSQIQNQIHKKDLAIVPLWHPHHVSVAHRRVKGYNPDLNGSFFPLLEVYKTQEKSSN